MEGQTPQKLLFAMGGHASDDSRIKSKGKKTTVGMRIDKPTSEVTAGPSTSSVPVGDFSFPAPKADWADERLDLERKKASKLARQLKKSEEREKRLVSIRERQESGLPPESKCPNGCNEYHWKSDCPKTPGAAGKRKRNESGKAKVRKETKKLRKAMASTSISDTDGHSRKNKKDMTVRAIRGVECPAEYADGTHGFIKVSVDRRRSEVDISWKEIVDSCLKAGMTGLVHGSKSGLKGWVVKFDKKDDLARATSIQKIAFTNGGHGLVSVYHSSGPRVFYTTNIGQSSIPDRLLVRSVAQALGSGVRFWIGREKYRGTTGPGVIIIMEKPFDRHRLIVPLQFGNSSKPYKACFLIGNKHKCCICQSSSHGSHSCDLISEVSLEANDRVDTLLTFKPSL